MAANQEQKAIFKLNIYGVTEGGIARIIANREQ